MLPEKLIYQSTFLVHLIQKKKKKKKKKKKQYRPVLIAPQVTKELYATLTLTLKQHSLKKRKKIDPKPWPRYRPFPAFYWHPLFSLVYKPGSC